MDRIDDHLQQWAHSPATGLRRVPGAWAAVIILVLRQQQEGSMATLNYAALKRADEKRAAAEALMAKGNEGNLSQLERFKTELLQLLGRMTGPIVTLHTHGMPTLATLPPLASSDPAYQRRVNQLCPVGVHPPAGKLPSAAYLAWLHGGTRVGVNICETNLDVQNEIDNAITNGFAAKLHRGDWQKIARNRAAMSSMAAGAAALFWEADPYMINLLGTCKLQNQKVGILYRPDIELINSVLADLRDQYPNTPQTLMLSSYSQNDNNNYANVYQQLQLLLPGSRHKAYFTGSAAHFIFYYP